MQSHLPTSMSQQPQDKNDDTTDEQNEKDPEELQKPPLKEEKLEEAAPAETTEKVKLQKNVQTHTKHLSIFLRERTLNYNENNEHI